MNALIPESVETVHGRAEVVRKGDRVKILGVTQGAAISALSCVPYKRLRRARWTPFKDGKSYFAIYLEV